MKFDIARQPLVPAFLTLAALAVVAMWNAGGPAVSLSLIHIFTGATSRTAGKAATAFPSSCRGATGTDT